MKSQHPTITRVGKALRRFSWQNGQVVDAHILQEDVERRRFIIRVLLIASIALSCAAILSSAWQVVSLHGAYRGTNPLFLLPALLFFVALYLLTKKVPLLVSYIFVSIYYLIGTYIMVSWGTSVPEGILVYVILIIIVGILLGSRAALGAIFLQGVTMLYLNYLELHNLTHPNLYWVRDNGTYSDTVVFIFSFLIIFFVSWLSNREIERSLLRARISEAALLRERDLLEVKVEERTRELQEAQQKELAQLYHFAQFGRLSSELLHDLVDPLSAVSVNLQKLTQTNKQPDLVQRALRGTQKMEQFVAAARRQIQQQRQVTHFSLRTAVAEAVDVLKNKAEKEGVTIILKSSQPLSVYADPIRFHRLISNLVSNAIDSFDGGAYVEKQITVTLESEKTGILLSVADTGKGIPADVLPHVLEPFYTTKDSAKGMGLGLSICKEITEQEFGGTLTIKSTVNVGTTVEVHMLTHHFKKMQKA